MKNLHIPRRAVPALKRKLQWEETLVMRLKALGRDYPRSFLSVVFGYVKVLGGLFAILVGINWCAGDEPWFGPRGMGALALAVGGGIAMGILRESFPRSICVKNSMLDITGAGCGWWPLASIIAVRC